MDVTNPGKAGQFWVKLVGIVTALAGVYFVGGGAWLAWLGGSGYFVSAGVLLLISGILLTRKRLSGAVFFDILPHLNRVALRWGRMSIT